MPPSERYIQRRIREYIDHKTKRRRLSQQNGERYTKHITRFTNLLRDAGLSYTPKRIGEREIDHLLTVWADSGLDTDTQQWYCSILSGYLRYHGNDVIRSMEIGWPAETRTNIDWLTPAEAIRMYRAALPGVERLVVHLELRLWLRRIEVRRLTPRDVLSGMFSVHGKGRGGGKWRHRAFAPDTMAVIMEYEQQREEMLERGRAAHENSWKRGKRKRPMEPFREPDAWIIYQKGKRVQGYSDTGIDNIVQRVADRAGIGRKIGNHALRRTGARLAKRAGVDIDIIKEGLGHEKREETYRYLGLTVDEQSQGEELVTSYLQQVEEQMGNGTVEAPEVRINAGAPR